MGGSREIRDSNHYLEVFTTSQNLAKINLKGFGCTGST